MIEIEGPDGVIYEFPEGTSEEVMANAMRSVYPTGQSPQISADQRAANIEANAGRQAEIDAMAIPPQNSFIGTAGQFGAGSQAGIAQALGFPVDAISGAINGAGNLAGYGDVIQNPMGGANTFEALLRPFNENIPAPATTQERMARRMGEEVGSSAVMAPVAMANQARPLAALGAEAVSALGSGTGAAVANEIAPDSAVAEIIGALAGGVPAGMVATRALGLNGSDAVIRPGIQEQKMRAADAYGEVRADPRILPQDSVDDLALGISSRMDAERINPRLQPGSSAVLDALLQDSSGPMRIEDVENLRRLTQQGLPATASPADRRLATMMTSDITDYLDNLDDPVADALRTGRDAHRRASSAQAIADAESKAARRAASTGTGGNEINAMRQNLRSVLDNPRKARSFTAPELAMIGDVVSGTGGQNAMRGLSRFAPSSGGLSSMLGIGGAMASPAIALPIMAATEGAKALGERSTRKSITDLLQALAPDRVLASREHGLAPILAALLGARTTANDE